MEIWTLKKDMQRLCANKVQLCPIYVLMCSKLGLQISLEISSAEKGPRHLETETIREPNCHSAGLMRTTCDIMRQWYTSLHSGCLAIAVARMTRGTGVGSGFSVPVSPLFAVGSHFHNPQPVRLQWGLPKGNSQIRKVCQHVRVVAFHTKEGGNLTYAH